MKINKELEIFATTVYEIVKKMPSYYYTYKMETIDLVNKSVGNYFETREKAVKYLEYLEAEAIIKQDTKGFEPDWNNDDENKYLGFWDLDEDKLDCLPRNVFKEAAIYFKSREDIKESFEKHPEEWKTYLTYEQ